MNIEIYIEGFKILSTTEPVIWLKYRDKHKADVRLSQLWKILIYWLQIPLFKHPLYPDFQNLSVPFTWTYKIRVRKPRKLSSYSTNHNKPLWFIFIYYGLGNWSLKLPNGLQIPLDIYN